MNYELIEELQDAGYPFISAEERLMKSTEAGMFKNEQGKWYLVPLLEELIVACGKNFGSLNAPNKLNPFWMVVTNIKVGKPRASKGQTPKEAVANLWLALNAT